jgi:hypothetical protein
MPRRGYHPVMKAIGDLLDGALPPERSGGPLVPVLRAWPAAVGPEIARHARPARRTRDGDLVVHCSDAGWAQTLTMMATDLTARLATELGADAPRSLRFRVGTVAAPSEVSASPPPPLPPQAVAVAGELAAPIADDRLREAAERVIARSLARPDSA